MVVVDVSDDDQLVAWSPSGDVRGAGVFTGGPRRGVDSTGSRHASRVTVRLHRQVVFLVPELLRPS